MWVLALALAVGTIENPDRIGDWEVWASVDNMTDARRIQASLKSSDRKNTLVYACNSKTDSYFGLISDEYLGQTYSLRVREFIVRSGDEEPEKLYVRYNDKSAYTYNEAGRRAVDSAMRRSDRLREHLIIVLDP